MKEMVGGCCVCSDDRGWPENPLVYCDGQSCTVAVHQACYGIVTVPTGPWYCRKCESQERSVKVKCELCPSKYGALKRTDNSGWAHVVCALYIPEVRFGNVTTMEPIQLQLIPQERFSKVCYICEENGKPSNASVGACMQCNKSGCKQQFHVTCAQSLGLLCEEAGNYLDNVKYCGYCQHHYSKLKKGGNVKTIPPYKPVSSENPQSDSSSEKEAAEKTTAVSASSLGKRKSSSNNKTSVSKVASNSKSVPAYQKSVASSKATDKNSKNNSSVKSAKSAEDSAATAEGDKTDKKDTETESKEVKDSGKGKKRKANSRTPTPNIISETNSNNSESSTNNTAVNSKKDSVTNNSDTVVVDKPKKAKTEAPTPQVNPPAPVTTVSPPTTAANTATVTTVSPPVQQTETTTAAPAPTTTHSIIQSTASLPVNSVVVSVPLVNTSLSPHSNNQTIVNPPPIVPTLTSVQEDRASVNSIPSASKSPEEEMITSELSSGGLKITFEKQPNSTLQVELEDVMANSNAELPVKRSRSQSSEKIEKQTRAKKKSSNGVVNALNTLPPGTKRSSRSQHNTPPPQSTSFGTMPQSSQIKDSPPSSPSSESLGAPPNMSRKKGRKSAPASVSGSSTSNSKDTKDNIKLFQNGVNAPHMLGNQLNLSSNMAQKMTDHLNSELEAHSIYSNETTSSNLIGPQLHHRVIATARSSSTGGSSTASGGSGLSSMLSGNGGVIPQTLDQLLERQWEQGSQFLMEQAQHFDIASLLSCLHQLRAENLRLEEHVSSLLQRRDHLLAVNARLAIPLTGPPATPQSSHPHTVNNIHPAVAVSHAEASRTRHSGGYPPHAVAQHPGAVLENGISSEQGYPHAHRSPAVNPPQPSPNVRQSSGGYPNSGLMRQNADTSGRSAPRPHYSLYQGSSNAQQQMVIRRESEQQHQNSTKPS